MLRCSYGYRRSGFRGMRWFFCASICAYGVLVSGSSLADLQINPYPPQALSAQSQDRMEAFRSVPSGNVSGRTDARPLDLRAQPRSGVRSAPVEGELSDSYSAVRSPSERDRVSALNAQKRRAEKRSVPLDTLGVVDVNAVPAYPVSSSAPAPLASREPTGVDVVRRDSVAAKPMDERALFETLQAAKGASTVDLNAIMLEAAQSGRHRGQAKALNVGGVREFASREVVSGSGRSSTRFPVSNAVRQNASQAQAQASDLSVTIHKSPVQPVRWSVVEGADVRDTLYLWAQDAGVDLVWNGAANVFDVLQTTIFHGSFEEAVRQFLDQYQGQLVRPVGRLFANPEGERSVLVIDVKRDV